MNNLNSSETTAESRAIYLCVVWYKCSFHFSVALKFSSGFVFGAA